MRSWQKYLAELLGTFILVFIGTTGVVAAEALGGRQAGSLTIVELVVPLCFGLALLAGLYAFAEVSGGHFNPAVSLGLFLDGRLSVPDLVGYWIFQFAGAIAASALMLVPFNKTAVAGTATVPDGIAGVYPPGAVGDGGAFLLEVVATAIFVSVILQSSKSARHGGTALLAIPLTLVTIHVALIPFTGSSVNPARTLGPALVGDKWDSEWIYFLGPALGAIIAWLIHSVVIKGETGLGPPAAETAQEESTS